jgi:hypothetical protein
MIVSCDIIFFQRYDESLESFLPPLSTTHKTTHHKQKKYPSHSLRTHLRLIKYASFSLFYRFVFDNYAWQPDKFVGGCNGRRRRFHATATIIIVIGAGVCGGGCRPPPSPHDMFFRARRGQEVFLRPRTTRCIVG